MGGRVVEGTGLENRQARKRLEGSNPSPSANLLANAVYSRLKNKLLQYILPYPHLDEALAVH